MVGPIWHQATIGNSHVFKKPFRDSQRRIINSGYVEKKPLQTKNWIIKMTLEIIIIIRIVSSSKSLTVIGKFNWNLTLHNSLCTLRVTEVEDKRPLTIAHVCGSQCNESTKLHSLQTHLNISKQTLIPNGNKTLANFHTTRIFHRHILESNRERALT